MSSVVTRGVVRAALCVSFSAKKKSVLKKSLEACGGDEGVVLHTRVREQF